MMNLILSLVLVSAAASSEAANPLKPFLRKLEALRSEVSLSVRGLDGKEWAEVEGLRLRAPASVAKAISTACALKTLGSEFQFQTQWRATGPIVGGVLKGDLVVKGGGDPSFVIEDLTQIIEVLRRVQGIEEIEGRLLFDLSYFGTKDLQISSGFEGDEGRSFASELTSFPFNYNSFSIWVSPSKPKPQVALLPHSANDFKIINSAKTVAGDGQDVSVQFSPQTKTISVSGSIGESALPRAFYRAVDDPWENFSRVFSDLWFRSGGKWKKPQSATSLSEVSGKLLWTHSSRSLGRILMDINKLSTNFAAELVGLAAAGRTLGVPVNSAKLQMWLNQCLKTFQLPEGTRLTNASGLSRESKISASGMTEFLSGQHEEVYFPEFLSSLAILGKDGTARLRLAGLSEKVKKNGAEGRARLKTGSLKDVRSLVGYIESQTRGPLTFALLVNSSRLETGEIHSLENQLLEILLEL